MKNIIINRREYAWGDLQVWLWGQMVGGLTGIEYTTKKEKEALYGAGRSPRGIQHKRREYSGTLTIMQSELQALNRSARANGYKDILDVDFDIVVVYLSAEGVVTTDKICVASISEIPAGMKEGDAKSEHALPYVAMDIRYNVEEGA